VPEFRPNFMATGIGSLPHRQPAAAVTDVLSRLAEMPYWPQLPGRDPSEGMNAQYAGALAPLLSVDPADGEVRVNPGLDRESALAGFYERLWGQADDFGLRSESAAGFFEFIDQVTAAPAEAYPWVKGHVTGPLTLAASVLGADGKAVLYDDEVAEAVARGLGAAAAAQAAQMAPLGRSVMIFFDEPFLSGFGSAFTPVARQRVVELLGFAHEEARQRCDAVLGVHCCGNTDWAMIVESGTDVLNLDSVGYGQHLLLYPEAVRELYARGSVVAWGAAPTEQYQGHETPQGLWEELRGLLDQVAALGVEPAVIKAQGMITPACGMGSLSQDAARAILDLTRGVSELARQDYG